MAATAHVEPEVAQTLQLGVSRAGRRWAWRVGLAVALVAAVTGGVLYQRKQKLARVPVFETTQIHRGDLRVVVSATGTLQPTNTVEVGPEISGRIKALYVDFNDAVKKGQLLAELDTEQLKARLDQVTATLAVAEAAVGQAQATFEEARANAARVSELAQREVVAPRELESATATRARAEAVLQSAKAQVTAARAELENARSTFTKAKIFSPIDGVVIARKVERGQALVSAFQTPVMFTLAEDLRQMHLHLDVDEADIGRVSEGQTADFTVDAYAERVFTARVKSIRNAARNVQGVVSYEAVLDVENPERLLRPGMTANATIHAAEVKDVLLVPSAALRFAPPGAARAGAMGPGASKSQEAHTPRVWKLEEGKPVAVTVKTGATDGVLVELREGAVAEGTQVLLSTRVPP